MSKRIYTLISLLVMAVLILTACGGGQTEQTQAPRQPTTVIQEEKITIRMWGHQAPAFNEANQKMFDDLATRIRIARAQQKMKVPFQTQIPNDKLLTPDWDKVVKKRRTTTQEVRQR